MVLEDSYTDYKNGSGGILPFLGFSKSTHSYYYDNTITTTTETHHGPFTVVENTPITKPERKDYTVYERKHVKDAQFELELEVSISNCKCYYDGNPLDMPYLSTSLKDHYEHEYYTDRNRGCFSYLAPLLCMSLSFTIAFFVIMMLESQGIISEDSPNFLSLGGSIVFGLPIITAISFWLVRKIKKIKKYGKRIKGEYNTLSISQKEKIRDDYFAYIIEQYGEEAGKALIEIAKIRDYDKI